MKKTHLFLSYLIIGIFTIFALVLTGCEGEDGAVGPAGPAGAAGADGADGADGSLSCLACHSAAKMDAIETAFEAHKHSEGTSWARGTSTSCAQCHSPQGYVEFVETGEAIAGNGTSLKCETCHVNHASLEEDITAPLREVGVVASIAVEGATYDHGAGNLCATCHQARRGAGYYDKYTVDQTFTRKFTGDDIAVYTNASFGPAGSATLNGTGDTLTVVFDVPTTHTYTSSTHAGPHHGPQSNMFAADCGTVSGTPFTRDGHTDCTGCHLNDATENGGFGHSFAPDIEQCNSCHGDAVDIAAKQDAIAVRIEAVGAALEAIHAVHKDDEGAYHPLYASLPKAEWNAFWNFMCLIEDKSEGVHNFGYAEQLLNNAENALGL